MALAVETPTRTDLSFRTNDDKTFGARWLKSDYETPVVVDSATLTLQFDPPLPPDFPHVVPLIFVPPDEIRIDSLAPGDPAGWFDPALLADGWVVANIPHTVWPGHQGRTGSFDLVAVGEGCQRVLVRGTFACEEGIT